MRDLVAVEKLDAEPEKPQRGFGKYSKQYMFQTGQNFRNHGMLPRAGAWDDQDPEWVDALLNWLAFYDYAKWEVMPRDERGGGNNDLGDFIGSQDAPDWLKVLG